MTMDPVIHTSKLRKTYGNTDAVCGLDLQVWAGRITGFLGRNGAGKSTTIKMLMGMIHPSSGEGMVLGQRIDDPAESVALRRRVAYVSEDKHLYDYMTVEQIIRFTSSFYADWRAEAAQRLLREYELPEGRKIKALSKGMRTKLALLLALARRPELLILDEPSEGLDPVVTEQMLASLAAHAAEGAAVFFSSHQIAEVERIADHICILEKGELILDVSLDDLRESYRQIDILLPSVPERGNFQIAGVERVRTSGHQVIVVASRNADEIVERARGWDARSIRVAPMGLREIYLELVKER
jgi:ABC-2 type transport system ATP-binding protein